MRFVTALAIAFAGLSPAQTITTVAGNTSWGNVYQTAVDAAGNIFVADSTRNQIYKVDPQGVSTVVAGTGTPGYSGDGAQATTAQLRNPYGVAVARDGTLYIADYTNDRIRRVAPNGIITTVAGTGVGGFTGDGGQATAARIQGPFTLVLNAAGDLYFVDYGNYRIRRITPAGVISTVAGTGRTTLSGDGGLATASDSIPGWMALGSDGSLYFSDDGSTGVGRARVRRVAPNGIITTFAGTGVSGFNGDGGPAIRAQFRSVSGIALDGGGNLFIAEQGGHRIRRVDTSGNITTYAGTGTAGTAGDGGAALTAQFFAPEGLTFDTNGNLFVVDRGNRKIRKISPPPVPAIRSETPVLTSFGGRVGFSSNTYVEIYGQNFTTSQRLWAGSDFNGANAPTSLDGVSVTVNGRPAFIYYISPNQININTPEDTATGPVAIQVTTTLGVSNTVMVNRARVAPTLQTVPQFLIDGRQYVVALTPDFATYIGRPGMLAGVNFAPARPGDTVSIYALGCGPTTPPTQAGTVASQASALGSAYRLRIGGQQATVTFAGVVGGTIGLYQFNVVVPAVAAGDQPVELEVDGMPNSQNLVITIGSR